MAIGRPLMLDELRAKRIVDAVRGGLPYRLAAQAAGISPATLKEWRARGRDGDEPFASLVARLEKAEGEASQVLMARIFAAAQSDAKHWTAAAWILERRYPELFALKREFAKDETLTTSAQDVDDLSLAKSVVAALESRKTGT